MVKLERIYTCDHPEAYIVAIHGLGGSWDQTWTHANGTFWLKDVLPKDFPRIDVLSADIPQWREPQLARNIISSRGMTNIAEDIMFRMSSEQKFQEEESATVIFVGHGLGGILAERMIITARLSAESHWTARRFATIFFGTPQRGSESSAIPEIIAKMLKLVVRNPNQELLRALQADSYELRETTRSFLDRSDLMPIMSIIEVFPTPRIGIVVPYSSASLGVPGETVFPSETSFLNLTKFSSDNDISYRRVRDFITFRIVTKPALQPPPSKTGPIGKPNDVESTIPLCSFHIHKISKDTPNYQTINLTEEDIHVDITRDWLKTIMSRAKMETSDLLENDSVVWFHLPINNHSWVHPCLRGIGQFFDFEPSILGEKYMSNLERRNRNKDMHSRFMLPSCHMLQGNRSLKLNDDVNMIQSAVYLPYLHWDTKKCFNKYSKVLKQKTPDESFPISVRNLFSVLNRSAGNSDSFHPRRSLDQFFYSKLTDTSIRDKDQVVSRQTRKSAGGSRMVIVDQLWLWILCSTSKSSKFQCVFTCFPEKPADDDASINSEYADLRKSVLEELWPEDRSTMDAFELAGHIIQHAVTTMFQSTIYDSLDFMELFREAIGDAAEKQTVFFRNFKDSLGKSGGGVTSLGQKEAEVKLALTISDIIDELNTLKRLLDTQKDALDSVERQLILIRPGERIPSRTIGLLSFRQTIRDLRDISLSDYRVQIDRMMEDAKRIQAEVLSLLDLQQKEANLFEARSSNVQAYFAREQSDLTIKQANQAHAQSRILLLFTVVTIVFLPLSFFTSYFGMNVRELTGDAGNESHGHVWSIMGPISFTIIIGLLILARIIYIFAERNNKYREKEQEIKWEKEGLNFKKYFQDLAKTLKESIKDESEEAKASRRSSTTDPSSNV